MEQLEYLVSLKIQKRMQELYVGQLMDLGKVVAQVFITL